MSEVIQNLLINNRSNMMNAHQLYCKYEDRVIVGEGKNKCYVLPAFSFTDFCTYFNSLSYAKWKKYTGLKNVVLKLDLVGAFVIRLVGYKREAPIPEKEILLEEEYKLGERTDIRISVPENSNILIGFEIETTSETRLFSGQWLGEFAETRNVELTISTTTCRKEAFIKNNVQLIYNDILNGDDEMKNHFYIHIVDNGNTLEEKDFPTHSHIMLHPNHNTGGAGGFARGMIESLHQKEPITHVLLMDDDVIVEPESMKRTYKLLQHLLKEYHKNFISGAMLYMENPTMQKEDVGYIHSSGNFRTWKVEYDHRDILANLDNEKEIPLYDNSYAAWWYCCIPMETIKANGLPLPVFVRGDDVEYGIRCNPGFITMNAICVWHMGFTGKFNVGMDHYQVDRNLLLDQAISGIVPDIDFLQKLKGDFRRHIMRFDYQSAEIVVKALEDFLKGPEFIKQDLGEKIVKENNKLGHTFTKLSEMGDPDWGMDPFYEEIRSKLTMFCYEKTWNGHRFWPFKTDSTLISLPYNDGYLPGKMAFKNRILAMNIYNRTGYILERNNQKGRDLIKRYKSALKTYKREKDTLRKSYAVEREYLTSEKFWREYLGI